MGTADLSELLKVSDYFGVDPVGDNYFHCFPVLEYCRYSLD